jgi:fused signal recognition particle receptor
MTSGRIGEQKLSLWQRLKRVALTDVGALVRGMNAADLEALERTLIEADFGVQATIDLVGVVEDEVRRGRLKTEADLQQAVAGRIRAILEVPGSTPGALARATDGPTVMVFVGVNGVGKTTSVARVARQLQKEGRSVLLAAADTYRAGAIQQLQTWSDRLNVPCVAGAPGGDPASVAFDAVEAALSRHLDTVLIDTAGRLHTQEGLMEELRKVVRVTGRKRPGAPHETLLVLDGTVGQNAIQQGKLFSQAVSPTGIIVTKLDGSARGGAVVALRKELGLPIRFIGVGEAIDDLEPFDAASFAARLLSDETATR